jgi:7-cyano-7-deazaguanine synthase
MANLAIKACVEGRLKIKIHAPLIKLTKPEIIQKGIDLGVDYGITHSCYDPSEDGKACGQCDSCILRKNGFKKAGVPDPAVYR